MRHNSALFDPGASLPTTFGTFRLHGRLGHGGNGVVLDATTWEGDQVALKLIAIGDGEERKRKALDRFSREAKALQSLRHAGVVRLYDAGELSDVFYLVMQKIRGATLSAIRLMCRIDFETLVWLGIQLAGTLQHLHEKGIVHRDIKPSNILVNRRGRPVIVDFGISTFEGVSEIAHRNVILGTLGYIAPEILDNAPPTPKADQYSLGRVLLSLACQFQSESGSRQLTLRDGLRIDWSLFPSGSPWTSLQIILQKMVADDPGKRYRDLESCMMALHTLWCATRRRGARPDLVLKELAKQALVEAHGNDRTQPLSFQTEASL